MSKLNKRDIKTVREALNMGISLSLVQPAHVQDLHASGIMDQPKSGSLPASVDPERVLVRAGDVMYYLVNDSETK